MAGVRPKMTEEEFMALPDDGYKDELVGGETRAAPANFEHDVIGDRIIALLMPYARGRGFVAGAQAGFRMRSDNIRCRVEELFSLE
ncbi:MAG: Uma2 family endonuclease [Armatimonadetes bacterium]|nr:Uma2 family endonuclease [Armatimonadota bacterium]